MDLLLVIILYVVGSYDFCGSDLPLGEHSEHRCFLVFTVHCGIFLWSERFSALVGFCN